MTIKLEMREGPTQVFKNVSTLVEYKGIIRIPIGLFRHKRFLSVDVRQIHVFHLDEEYEQTRISDVMRGDTNSQGNQSS